MSFIECIPAEDATKIMDKDASHVVLKDDIYVSCGTRNECFKYIQDHQSQSVQWAIQYEGWSILSLDEFLDPSRIESNTYVSIGQYGNFGSLNALRDFLKRVSTYSKEGEIVRGTINGNDINDRMTLTQLKNLVSKY